MAEYQPNFLTFATVQTIQKALKKYPDDMRHTLAQFQGLAIDEAHRVGSEQFNDPGMYCTNAYYRYALTATPFMRNNVYADMSLLGITGRVIAKVPASLLIDRGILAKPFFKYFTIGGPDMTFTRGWRNIYEQGIINNKYRNEIIVKQASKQAEKGKKILIITQEIKHGKMLFKKCQEAGINTMYQSGVNPAGERAKALKWLSRSGSCIVCTNIFDEGIDVKDINVIINGAGCKSAPAVFQRAGRAMRKKEDDKNYAIIMDFMDKQHPRLLDHSRQRYNLIKNTKGFTIL